MNLQALNQDLESIIQQRSMLSMLDYSDESYDEAEEKMHELQDNFLNTYGDYLEDILIDICEEYGLSSEAFSPISCIARSYTPFEETADGQQYRFKPSDAAAFELKKAPKMDARLVFVPNPVRLLLVLDKKEITELWRMPVLQ